MILKDKSVLLKELKPQLVLALLMCNEVFRKYGSEVIITSLNDGKHSLNSKHYSGEAVDIRSKHLSTANKRKILEELRLALSYPKLFDVLLEYENQDNEHFHIEYDPK